MQFTKTFSDKVSAAQSDDMSLARAWLDGAEAIVIGAGAGLSAAAGFTYSGKRFHENFHDFETKYHFSDMYSGGFYPFETAEEYWAYWSRYVLLNRYTDAPKPVYRELFELVKEKNYFVITTNVDHCFQKSGFDKNRLFYTQGDYGLFQCSAPCCDKTYDNEQAIREMAARQKDMKIPAELVPKCPVCGRAMTMNLRCDERFAEDDGWRAACGRYKRFLKDNKKKKTVYLELGVGMNTPAIIKYPFWKMVAENKNARYVCVNKAFAYAPDDIKARSLCFAEDIAELLNLLAYRESGRE